MTLGGQPRPPDSASSIPELKLEFTRGSKQSSHLAALARGAALDIDSLAAWTLGDLPGGPEQTPYREVQARLVEPRTNEDSVEVPPPSPAGAAVALRHALRRAVDRAAGSAKRLAVMTGGGVDSSAILALAVDVARERGGSAFGLALDYRAEGDDRPHLRALESHLGCEVIRVSPEAASHRRALVEEGIDAAPLNVATGPMEIEVMARGREHGAEVVLTGAGGDELLDGDPRALAGLVRAGRPKEALRAARALRGFEWQPRSLFGWLLRPLFVERVPRAIRLWRARRARPWIPEWSGPALRAAGERSRERALARLDERLSRRATQERAPSEIYRVFHAWYRHQMEVATGAARRDPYLDRRLVAFVHGLPPEWLLVGDIRRGLFREAMRGLLPESLRMREDKASFEPAMFRWVESVGGFESFRHLVSMEHLASLGLVEPSKVAPAFEELARNPITTYGWGSVWPALSVEAFLRARDAG